MKRYWWVLALAGFALAQTATYHSVASSKQLMAAIQKPAMDALTAVNKAGGPKTEEEWTQVQQHAAVLAESAQLLLMGSRPLDQDVWIKTANSLDQAASKAVQAADVKDWDGFKTAMNGMAGACRGCHNVHKKKKQ
jgi:cytochrome c556